MRATILLLSCLLVALSLATQAQAQGNGKQVAIFCEIQAGSVSPTPGTITCPAGTYVYIANAFWGRRDTVTQCSTVPSDSYFSGFNASTKCEGAGSTIYDSFKFCNNNPSQTCTGLEPSVDVLGTPSQTNGQSCDKIYKFLEVTYYCVANNCNSKASFASTGFNNAGILNDPPTSDCTACSGGYSGPDCGTSPCIDASGAQGQNCFNGSCNASTGKCDCNAGFGGTTCQCNNDTDCNGTNAGGACDNTKVSGCVCNTGFGGLDCQCQDVNCNSPTKGSCDPAGTAGACKCNTGFGGANCSCTQAACNPKNLTPAAGQCNPTASDGSCQCNGSWTGLDCGCNTTSDCGVTATPQAQGTCNASGTIDSSPCTCTPGFGGLHCNCINAACGNNSTGTCDNTKEDQCTCFTGYGGLDCSCQESLCNHGATNGTCDPNATGSTLSSPKCICNAAAGFGGDTCGCDKNAQNKINGCFGHGDCASDWDCDCNVGWFGDHCNCSEELCNWQGCNSRTGDCICPAGWGGDNCQCHPVITSKLDFHGVLDANGTCNQVDSADNKCNSDGTCACGAGFNGPNCECADSARFLGDTKKHCNGRGTCQADGSCLCNVDANNQPLYGGDQCECSNTPDLANPSLFHCSGHGTCASGNSCVCDLGWAGVQCDICAPTYYPKTTEASGPYCVNQCKDAVNTVEQSLSSTGAKSCNNQGTCGGTGVCTCNTGYVNDDTAFATNGDCDAQFKVVCPGAALSLSCATGKTFATLHADYGTSNASAVSAADLTAALTAAGCSAGTCTNAADNAKTYLSAICDGTIGASFAGCSLATVNDLTLTAAWAPTPGTQPCSSANSAYLSVVYSCT